MKKARIVKVGDMLMIDGKLTPAGWKFDHNNDPAIPAFRVDTSQSDYKKRYIVAGYTVEELIRIKEGDNILNGIT